LLRYLLFLLCFVFFAGGRLIDASGRFVVRTSALARRLCDLERFAGSVVRQWKEPRETAKATFES
jgi:hypothetical protein